MPLIRIELRDFKSYRGHQTIGPFKNFTSIIGPNGAGKSNLMDAISFVLGVKSAQLRSSQLKDLVYRGRRLARPDNASEQPSMAVDEDEEEGDGEGTAKKAWVLAVYCDADDREWRFQRTISTTGASEYKLDDRVVTYSAYNAALMKHNILVKAKNFLVFQGDVEAVASQSPRELSRLIEQISGSLELAAEYEKAKEEQERATENATFNFTKRRGIFGEIKQYKEQKGEAERFEALVQERDLLILHRILFKLYHIEDSIEVNAHEIREQNKALAGLREEQRVHDKALENARTEQAKARTSVMQAEKKIKKAEKAFDAKKPDLVATEAQITHGTRKHNNAMKTKEDVNKTESELKQRLGTLQTELEQVKKLADEASDAQRKASHNNLALSEESLEEYRRLKASASVLAIDERQSLETLTREEKTSNRTLTTLSEKQKGLEEKRNTRSEELKTQLEKKTQLDEKIAGLQEELAKVKQELDNQASERQRIRQLEEQTNEKLQRVFQDLLQAGVERGESERERRLKETLENLQRIFPGVRGRVVDLCKPSQRKYETAVSVVLGRNIDAVVVDEEKTAIDCIEYMRNQRAGQATFIPLDTIQVKPVNDKFRSFAKGARLAVDVIQYEPAVERAIHHACGNALVCDTMDVAKYVCYEKGQEVKAVTLEGTIIHKSGLITGGRSHHGPVKNWDDKDIQGLQRSRDSLQAKLRELAKQRPRGKTDDTLIADISRLESSITIAKDDLNACKLRITGLKDELKHLEQEIKKTTPELSKAQATYDNIRQQIASLSEVVNSAEDGMFKNFCRKIKIENIREYEERQLKLAQEESEARLRFENQIARLTHQSEFEGEALKNAQERIKTLDGIIETEKANLIKLEAQKSNIEMELEEMEQNINELRAGLTGLQEILEGKTRDVEQVKRTTSKASKTLEQALKEISVRNDEIEKLALERSSIYRKCRLEEIQLPLLSGNLKNVPMEENLRDEVAMDIDQDEDGTQRPKEVRGYGIEVDFEEVDEDEREREPAEALAEFDASITKLSGDIERMAPNMKAVDRLEDVEVKLAETEQETEKARKDSREAKDKFQDIQRRRTEMFMKAYAHISDRIDQVYKDLTKGKAAPMGGVAYLSLDDAEEPYNGGIKYHAMPPMKRFRDMEQLSGGEKTVAALALLFAIHSYQPAPFFVLDEVDAALDNTNVAKVANYIRTQASDAFQFIVISLKGSLYERGHSLVGIYRDQDVNSSRTLTLDLTQYDE
ncbi:hypothetical protein E1B28_005672 [Marasmius oreades]|uniref:Structural maintenance of chromosomes protein n=1 Tax=Marasmius oreades TaxID=181124 RepID=A0A9P7UW83_9AGAR|nr:uncharacterized protein E1B28_005672 [Marasmius oreades]KAG7094864.1 hypothetical protein E1B28_005672 [Marasmius oreades]